LAALKSRADLAVALTVGLVGGITLNLLWGLLAGVILFTLAQVWRKSRRGEHVSD